MHPLLIRLDKYHIPWNKAQDDEEDGFHVTGPLPSGDRYNLWADRCGDWELWDGRRRHTGSTEPELVYDMAFSALLCLYGKQEGPLPTTE